jgi:hypothetical protein
VRREEDIMRMRMRILRSLRKLVIAYTKNEIKTTTTTMTPIRMGISMRQTIPTAVYTNTRSRIASMFRTVM